jgi:hypothetical protein
VRKQKAKWFNKQVALVQSTVSLIVQTQEPPMRVTVSDAKGQLTELVRRAEAGEEVHRK